MWLKKAESDVDTLLKDKKYLQALAAIADAGGEYPHTVTVMEDAYDQITGSATHDTQEDFKLRLLTALVERLDLGVEFKEMLQMREDELNAERAGGEVWDDGGHKRY